jgi:hypothetical protein
MPQPLRRTCSAQGAVHESRWTRVTSFGAMTSVVVRFCVRCRVAESVEAQPRALAAAAAVRVPMLFTGAVAVGSPLHRNAAPLFVGTARMVSFPDHLAYISRRQTSSAPENAEGPDTRPGGWFRRTKDGERPLQVLLGPAGPILAETHQPSAPRGPRTIAMVQGATPDAASRTDTFQKTEGVFFE